MIHIWGFDVGETTGWVHVSWHKGGISHYSGGELAHNDLGDMLHHSNTLRYNLEHPSMASSPHEFVFICERPLFLKGESSKFSAETAGLIKWFAHRYGIPFIYQNSGDVLPLITNKVLKTAGVYTVGKGHQRDAARHAIYWLTTEKGVLKECLRPFEPTLVMTGNGST